MLSASDEKVEMYNIKLLGDGYFISAISSLWECLSWCVCTVQIGNKLTQLSMNASAHKWQMNRLAGFSQLLLFWVVINFTKSITAHLLDPEEGSGRWAGDRGARQPPVSVLVSLQMCGASSTLKKCNFSEWLRLTGWNHSFVVLV